MLSPPPSPKFRTRSPGNSSSAPSPQEMAEPNPESFYQGLESSMDQVDFERFFAKFPIESDISKFFENFPLSTFHVVMVETLKNVSLPVHDSPHGHLTRRARLVLEKELRILDGVLGVLDGAELQVTDTRDELRRLKSEIQGLMGQEIPAEADSSNPVHPTVVDVDYGTVGSGSWDTHVYNSPSREAHERYSTVPPSSVGYPPSSLGYSTIPPSSVGYPTISPSCMGYPTIPPSSVRYPPSSLGYSTIPPSSVGYPTISPSYMGYPTIPPSSVGYPTILPSSLGYPTVPPSSVMYPTIPPSSISVLPTPSMQSSQRPPGFHDTPTPSEHRSRNSTSIVPTRYRTALLNSRPEDTAQTFQSDIYYLRDNPRNNSSSWRRQFKKIFA